MNVFTARVQNRRIVMDIPTDLPDGSVVALAPLHEVLPNGADVMDPACEAALCEALVSLKAGRIRTLEQVKQTVEEILRGDSTSR